MSEFHFDITNDQHLDRALMVAASKFNTNVEFFMQQETEGGNQALVLYWGCPSGAHMNPLVARTEVVNVQGMITDWLKAQDYGVAPDCDGSVKKGWRLYGGWTGLHQFRHPQYAVLAVEPAWLEYHK